VIFNLVDFIIICQTAKINSTPKIPSSMEFEDILTLCINRPNLLTGPYSEIVFMMIVAYVNIGTEKKLFNLSLILQDETYQKTICKNGKKRRQCLLFMDSQFSNTQNDVNNFYTSVLNSKRQERLNSLKVVGAQLTNKTHFYYKKLNSYEHL